MTSGPKEDAAKLRDYWERMKDGVKRLSDHGYSVSFDVRKATEQSRSFGDVRYKVDALNAARSVLYGAYETELTITKTTTEEL